MASPWLFPGGVGCFFDDRPPGDGLKFEKWLERFGADVAFPFVALNMACGRMSAEKSRLFLKSHVEGPPANAAEIQCKLRAGDHSFLDRLRRFGGGFLRGTDAYWAEALGDVDAWIRYQVEQGADPRRSSLRGVAPSSIGPIAFIGPRGAFTSIQGNLRISGRTRQVGTRQCMITPSLPRSFPRRCYRST